MNRRVLKDVAPLLLPAHVVNLTIARHHHGLASRVTPGVDDSLIARQVSFQTVGCCKFGDMLKPATQQVMHRKHGQWPAVISVPGVVIDDSEGMSFDPDP
jgi:hypothetical protein